MTSFPKLFSPLIETPQSGLHVEQDDLRIAFDEPIAEHNAHAGRTHRVDGVAQRTNVGLAHLHLGSYGCLIERSDRYVVVAEFAFGYGHFASYDRVDTAD